MRVVIFLTAYNEEDNIVPVLEKALKYGTVIVIDDGSTDRTPEIARELGAQVVRHPMNLGQGIAVVTGFIVSTMGDYDVSFEMDADGQHDPDEIPVYLAKLEESGADIVVGSRRLGSNHANAAWARRLFLPMLTGLLNWITGYRITDYMCGFRAFRTEALRRALPDVVKFREPQYMASELFIRFSRLNLTVAEVPINLSDRSSGVSRKGLFRYGWGVGGAILKTLLERRK